MADKKVTIETEGAREAAKDLRDVGKAAKDAGDDVKKAGIDSEEAGRQFDESKGKLDALKAAFLATVVAVGALIAKYADAEDAHKDLQKEMKDLAGEADDLATAIGKTAAALTSAGTGLIDATAKWMGVIKEDQSVFGVFVDDAERLADAVADGDFTTGMKKLVEMGAMLQGGGFIEAAVKKRLAEEFGLDPEQFELGQGNDTRGRSGRRSGYGMDQNAGDLNEGKGYIVSPDTGFDGSYQGPKGGKGKKREGPSGFEGEFGGGVSKNKQDVERELLGTTLDSASNIWGSLKSIAADGEQAIVDTRAAIREEGQRQVEERNKEMLKAEIEAEKERQAAIAAGGEAAIGIAGTIADQFAKTEGQKAAISAAMEAARSIAAFAVPNIPGGIAHAAAAAKFGIVAATAGKRVPGGSSDTPRVSGAGARQREDLGLLGEQSRSQAYRQDVRPLTVNIHSAFPPTPKMASELARAVERDRRR